MFWWNATLFNLLLPQSENIVQRCFQHANPPLQLRIFELCLSISQTLPSPPPSNWPAASAWSTPSSLLQGLALSWRSEPRSQLYPGRTIETCIRGQCCLVLTAYYGEHNSTKSKDFPVLLSALLDAFIFLSCIHFESLFHSSLNYFTHKNDTIHLWKYLHG